jgi:hypothetical protein
VISLKKGLDSVSNRSLAQRIYTGAALKLVAIHVSLPMTNEGNLAKFKHCACLQLAVNRSVLTAHSNEVRDDDYDEINSTGYDCHFSPFRVS